MRSQTVNRANETTRWQVFKQVESITRWSNLPVETSNRKLARLLKKEWRTAHPGDEQITKTRRHAVASEERMWNKK